MALGGMRDIQGIVHETSLLDPEEGIRFRNYTIEQCQRMLPKAPNGHEPLPEGLFWLLVTGEIPTEKQVQFVSEDWIRRLVHNPLPSILIETIKKLPKEMHPMTQLSISVMMLQHRSTFAKAYHSGTVGKDRYWEFLFEDINDIIAVLPSIASLIYCNKTGKCAAAIPKHVSDWAGRFAYQLGNENESFRELLRLYMTIHSDHEGGNVSAHAAHLVGSSLSDPYLAYSACINGLAGPLHGLANQEVLLWLNQLKEQKGLSPTHEQIQEFILQTLSNKKVVPGYGHAVLRKTDPRFECQMQFAKKHIKDDPNINLVHELYQVAPKVLSSAKKSIANPYPNVDAHSGVLLKHYGFVEEDFFTVLFAVSRALGALSGLLWDRILELPIERPKSVTTDYLKSLFESNNQPK